MSRTICRSCEEDIDDKGKKIGEYISHCGKMYVVGNKKYYKPKNIEIKKEEEMEEVKKEKKSDKIVKLLNEGKTIEEIATLVNTSKSYVLAVKKSISPQVTE